MTADIAPVQPDSPAAFIRQRRLSLGDPVLGWSVRILSWAALAAIVLMLLAAVLRELLDRRGVTARLAPVPYRLAVV